LAFFGRSEMFEEALAEIEATAFAARTFVDDMSDGGLALGMDFDGTTAVFPGVVFRAVKGDNVVGGFVRVPASTHANVVPGEFDVFVPRVYIGVRVE
jgi:hypothetical protein